MSLLTRTTRRVVTLVSLGLAGLLAGLLSGCASSSDEAVDAPASVTTSAWEFTTATTPSASHAAPFLSIDAGLIPPLHHPPSTRRLQYGSTRTFNSAPTTNAPRRS
jgi:hypothetical protein